MKSWHTTNRKKIFIFSVFLFIASGVWFLNALSGEYTSKIVYPVTYKNIPENISDPGQAPKSLNLTVKASGFRLLRLPSICKNPLVIDLAKHAVRNTNTAIYTLQTEGLIDNFFPNSEDVEIIQIHPSEIHWTTGKMHKKKVPVKLDISLTAKKLYMQSDHVVLQPDSISIFSTNAEKIARIKSVTTIHKEFSGIDSDLKISLALRAIKGVRFSTHKVDALIPIEKYTEQTLSVPVTILHPPEDKKMLIFPNELTVSYRVPLNKYDTMHPSDFELVLDYATLPKSALNKAKVNIRKYPDYVKQIKLEPAFVDFIFEKSE